MNIRIQKTTSLSGTVTPPSSKSQNIRGILFASLAKGRSILSHFLASDDTSDAIHLAQTLGVHIEINEQTLIIDSKGLPFETSAEKFYSGNSGLTTLFSLPFFGLRKNADTPIIFDCGKQMRSRPIHPLVDALNALGMHISYVKKNEQCPLKISGQLSGGKTTVDGFNSQYLSSLLISLPCAPNDSEISVKNLHERPYVEMTLAWLNKQNIIYTQDRKDDVDIFHIQGKQIYQPFQMNIPADFSSAAYLIIAATLLPGKVIIEDLDINEHQSDKSLIPLLQKMGGDLTLENDRLIIQGGKKLTGIEINANDFPDLIPALAIIGTQATGKTHIYNVKHARIKETDRIHSMTQGLRKLQANVAEHEDGMTIWESQLKGAELKGFGDHRTIMSLSIAGLVAEGITQVDDAEAINKTFPTFLDTMQSLGAHMALTHE